MRTFLGVALGMIAWVFLSYGSTYALIRAFNFSSEHITFPWVAMCLGSTLLAAAGTGLVCAKFGGLKSATILSSIFVIWGLVGIVFRLIKPQRYRSSSVNLGNGTEYLIPTMPIWFNPLVTALSIAVLLFIATKVSSGPTQRTIVASA